MSGSDAPPVAVLGAGSWGTALALLLAEGGAVRLWDRTPALVESLRTDRENRRYLPGFSLPPAITVTADMAEALAGGAACIVVAVPSAAVGEVLALAAPYLPAACDIVLAAKGLEPDTGQLPFEVAGAALAPAMARGTAPSLVALSGPNLAAEVARGVPAAAVAACPDMVAAHRVAERFNRPAFRVYVSADRTGVEMGGAIKNVLAIAGGVSDGLGYGDNTKAALLTRGLAEMTRLGVAYGALPETFYGLAGVGDLMATAASRLSRNWRVGEGLAKGGTLQDVLTQLGQVAEGVPTARAVARLAAEKGVEAPVCAAVHALLFEGVAPSDVVMSLTARTRRGDWGEE